MCGFYGIVANELDAERHTRIVGKGLAAIRHRGPDEMGVYVTPRRDNFSMAVLGHVRLSIIDLTGGHQPMVDDKAKLVLVYNGEIYNYKSIKKKLEKIGYIFKEQSDTEVLLRAYQEWGERCVKFL
jgi:asparagine synthase (glutamine-hydrolysing)